MGSFQQVLMGATCVAAAFFFGSYLHNRPADNEQIDVSQVASVDPLDSIFSFTKNANSDSRGEIKTPTVIAEPQNQGVAQPATAPVMPAIDPSERTPMIAAMNQGGSPRAQSTEPNIVPAATRKPVVPDFSELASRFRNSPLELSGAPKTESVDNAVHESERAPAFSSVFNAPQMVIRQPEKATPIQSALIKDCIREVDRIEDTIRSEFARSDAPSPPQSEATRWRVNRSQQLDQFRNSGRSPQQDSEPEPRETIEDVLSRRSADYLKNADDVKATFATDPVQDDWMTAKRRKVTQQAAMRNKDLLEIEDPGNRFQSVLSQAEAVDPPQPDNETAYYTPTPQRQDSVPPRGKRAMQRIQTGVSSNWNRQSNIQKQFANTYEIQAGDTLQSISMRFYGSADYYLEIYKANREVLDRITSSPVGVEIEIPNLNN